MSPPPPAAPAPPGARGYARFWLTFVLLVAADQVTKLWVTRALAPNTYFDPPPVPVINGFFYIVNVTNRGAAWSILSGHTAWLAWLGVVALAAIYHFRGPLELRKTPLQYVFGLLCGGIVGNLFDRVVHGQVVDFLDFHLPGYRYPAFNLADSGITVGVIAYMVYCFIEARPKRRAPAHPPVN
jgi:signal peptidase II